MLLCSLKPPDIACYNHQDHTVSTAQLTKGYAAGTVGKLHCVTQKLFTTSDSMSFIISQALLNMLYVSDAALGQNDKFLSLEIKS